MKKLLIDVNSAAPHFVSGRVSGIGRTTIELVRALSEIEDLPFDIELYSQNMKGVGAHNFDVPFKKRHLWLPHRECVNKLSLRDRIYDYDLLHIPHNFDYIANPKKAIITIHDALFFTYPEQAFNPDFARKHYTELAQKCKAIITCSESSKRDIVKYMGVSADKVNAIHWGYNDKLFYPRVKESNKYCGDAPYFIAVSCDIGRKNTISIVNAFGEYAKNSNIHHLILVWRNPSQEVLDAIEKYKITNRVHFASNIPDNELATLYSSATTSFFPSLYEGFGLPIIESLACGVPVVTCANSSLEEVGGDAAIYVEPYDIMEMSRLMLEFENNGQKISDLRLKSILQAKNFSWKKCAIESIAVYKKILEL